jgi:hypothetical protein
MGLILGVVVINVGIGLFQEGKAEQVRRCSIITALYST